MMREHGGPDAKGVPRWDFSTNANACGPCPVALDAVRRADAAHYPDPNYTSLRESLAAFHQVDSRRVVIGASASELIARLTACAFRAGARHFWQPVLAYGDYALAAQAWRLQQVDSLEHADLVWLCEPSSPLGAVETQCVQGAMQGRTVVLDRAYEPLRLSGHSSFLDAELDAIWQLWSPNKALGLTGVRGAYAIAPVHGATLAQELQDMAASWPLGAHGVAMLQAWVGVEAQQWLVWSRHRLGIWKQQQLGLLEQLGWECLPSVANYVCASAPGPIDAETLRDHGVKLRDTRSFGLPGYWRLSVQSPEAQGVLRSALMHRKERVT